MGLLWVLLIGLVVGAVAKLLMPGKDPGGIIVTMILGVVGSMVAYFVGNALGLYRGQDQTPGLIASILGAMLVLGIYRLIIGRRRA
jgi:uncharacterized membrane protein YeaQ/YmgE (transglycosylase-associated protein family)